MLQLHRMRHLRGATSVLHPCNDVTANDAAHKNAAATSVFAQQNTSHLFNPPTTPLKLPFNKPQTSHIPLS